MIAARAPALGALAVALCWALPAGAQDIAPFDAQDVQPGQNAGESGIPAPPPGVTLPEVEPVIPDEEFEDAIPDLDTGDPALDEPLESIDAFERRIAEQTETADADLEEDAEQQAAQTAEQTTAGQTTPGQTTAGQTTEGQTTGGQEAPLGIPALADGDPVEEIGDAPIRDSELAAPLPPLSTFDVEPVELAEEAASDEPVEIAYDIRIDGLEDASEETETDMRAMFDSLATLREDGREAANVAQVSARLTEDSALLEQILASEGWYEAEVTTRIDRSEDEALTAVLDVVPGQRFTFSDITIDSPPVVPQDLLAENFPLQVGEPIVATRVQAAEAGLAITLPQMGYPFYELGQRDILLDQYEGTGSYTLPLYPGARTAFGGIETTGDLAFDAEHIEVLARFEEGQLYDSEDVDDLRKALVATGLFNTVSVTAEPTGQSAGMVEGPDGAVAPAEYATIVVDQEAGPPRTLAGGAGYGTDQGIRVQGSWTHRNMFPPEGALGFNAILGTNEQGLGASFRRSNAGRRDRTFALTADINRSDYDAFEAFTGRLGINWSYGSTPLWQKRLSYAYGAQLIGTVEESWDPELQDRVQRTYFIGGLTGQIGLDTTDDLLNATEGFRLTALIEPEGSLQDGFTPYVRSRLDGSTYFSATDSIVLAARVALGSIQGIDRGELAPSRRFYAGGGGSVRGYGYQELGPRSVEPNPDFDPDDPDNDEDEFEYFPIGGRSFNEGSFELRYRWDNFGVVGFVDAGQVYEETAPQFSDLRYGAGIGGRYYTNFGPLRVDVAVPLNRREGDSKFGLYISIGQAF